MVFWIWGSLFVLTVIAEIASQQLISIWFAAGSLVALLAALCGAPIWLQALLFVAASALLRKKEQAEYGSMTSTGLLFLSRI